MDFYPCIYDGKAKNPDFSTFKVRQQTFEEVNVFNKSLAKAGFYSTGYPGCVGCFYCGCTIKGLRPVENVWVAHAEYSPDCEYLKLHKGEKFIQKARNMTDHEDAMKEDEEKDLDCNDTDQMIEDLNSGASRMMMDRGYKQEQTEDGIRQARQKYGNGELKAAYILEYLFDTKSIKSTVKFCSATPSSSTRSYQAPSSFTFSEPETTEILDEGNGELKAANILEYLYDTESIKTPRNFYSTDAKVELSAELVGVFPGISDGKAKNPDFSTFKARQKTFEEENPYNESLAKAGFYRTGLENVVTCFYCGVSIMSLDPNKNVWVQHAMYSPDCGFLNLNKREIHRAIHPIRLDEDKDLNCIDKDQMIEDKNSRTSMMLMKGYRNEEVENGILKAREKYEKLLKEINALKSRMACKICLDNEACVLFQPCGHMVSCVKCASNLKTCAICRVEITNTIRAYPV